MVQCLAWNNRVFFFCLLLRTHFYFLRMAQFCSREYHSNEILNKSYFCFIFSSAALAQLLKRRDIGLLFERSVLHDQNMFFHDIKSKGLCLPPQIYTSCRKVGARLMNGFIKTEAIIIWLECKFVQFLVVTWSQYPEARGMTYRLLLCAVSIISLFLDNQNIFLSRINYSWA